MKFADFREKTKEYPLIHSHSFTQLTDDVATLRRQVHEWVRKGWLLQLKSGVYTLRDDDRKTGLSRYFIANQLYFPSYVSLETALSFYGMIPEAVYTITSITSKKSQRFSNKFGQFVYHSIKPDCFGGFITIKDEFGYPCFLATKEKAIIDLLYFRTQGLRTFDKSIFEEFFRLQNLSQLNKEKLMSIALGIKQKKLISLITLLIEHMEET